MTDDLNLTQNELKSTYKKLSISEQVEYDFLDDCELVLNAINTCFDKTQRQILTEDLQKNTVLLNNHMAILLNYCKQNHDFKKPGIIFINYCDYFSLDYNKTYIEMHEKIQKLIIYSFQCMVGVKTYNKLKLKANNGVTIKTLFDLVK